MARSSTKGFLSRRAFRTMVSPSRWLKGKPSGLRHMPNFTFELRDGRGGAVDPTGVALADRRQALHYARKVIHELMHGRELETRSWRLDVVEDGGECIFEIPFDSVDA